MTSSPCFAEEECSLDGDSVRILKLLNESFERLFYLQLDIYVKVNLLRTSGGKKAMSENNLSQLNEEQEKFREKAQKIIRYCEDCQSHDSGEIIWVLGEKMELDDILDELGVLEEDYNIIAEHLYCPYCDSKGFSSNSYVGVDADLVES